MLPSSRSFLILLSALFFACTTNAQEFLRLDKPEPGKSISLVDMERKFLEWAKDKDLSKTKGWKWYARWMDEQIKRSDFKGSIPNQLSLFEAAQEVARQKKQQILSRNVNNWMPLGPSVYPDVGTNPILEGLGRINTVAFHPTDPQTLFVGVAQGGLWKSSNRGTSWTPLTDDLPIIRISDIAIDPNDPDVMYICVGDYAYLGIGLALDSRKRHTHYGLGVFKTTDGGLNWTATALSFDLTERDASLIRRVIIDPNNSNRLVAVGVRGVWRSEDAGASWNTIMNEVMMDIEQDQNNPQVLYASSGYIRNLNEGRAAIWKSVDFGANWSEQKTGIPPQDSVQRIELAISPSNSDYIYAIASRPNGGLFGFYQTTNAGQDWELRAQTPNILHWFTGTSPNGQGNYDLGIMVDPEDPEKVYAGGINMWGTEDGGLSWKIATYWLPNYGSSVHADHHYYAYNPLDDYFYLCHDGGIARTANIFLSSWEEIEQSPEFTWSTVWEHIAEGMEITSFYRMGFSPSNAGYYIAGAQDNSNMLKAGDEWKNVMLGDGMEGFFHPDDENIFFTSTQFGRLSRSEDGGKTLTSSLTDTIRHLESGAWTTPFAVDPNDPETIYAAFGNIWKSQDLGDNWERLSDFAPIPNSTFITPTSTMSIAPSDPQTIYVGKRIYPVFGEKGSFWRTSDGGQSLQNITAGLPDTLFFTSSTVSDIDHKVLWVCVGGFADGVKVFRSNNSGDQWTNISYNLPNVPVNSIRHQAASPNNTLYIGTDIGVFYLNDELNEWQLYSDGLPNVIVSDLRISPERNKIYAATFGRGLWVGDLAYPSITSIDLLEQLVVNLFPNPNQGRFRLALAHPHLKTVDLQLVDILGRSLHHDRKTLIGGSLNEEFELNLTSGMYFLRISSGKHGKVVKFRVE